MRRVVIISLQLTLLALAACAPDPKVVIQRDIEPCPVEIEPPDCPDFPPHGGKAWEVVIDERDLTYARCRGWANTFWTARQECAEAK